MVGVWLKADKVIVLNKQNQNEQGKKRKRRMKANL